MVPILNLAVPASSPLHLSAYAVTLIGKYLCYATLALAVDLVWGYCGILSLGHMAFFALGGYAMGMYLMRQIGTRGVYGHPVLPDFMVFLSWTELPWFWHGFDQFGFAILMVVLAPSLLAFVFGWLAFRSRVTGVYLSIMTQALTYALDARVLPQRHGFRRQQRVHRFQGHRGIRACSATPRGRCCSSRAPQRWRQATGSAVTIAASRAGRVIHAIRDAESRTRFLGYRVESYKLWVFVVSAVIAGVAGALYVPQVGIINPGEFAPINSIEAVIWVAVGGRGTLVGAAAGAVMVNYAKTYFTAALPEVWLYALGALFVLVTLFLPRGLAGLLPRTRAHMTLDKTLYLEKLTVSFDGFKALDSLSLFVDPGELLCVIGPNGAGKTTMMDVVTGKTRPDSGTAWFGRRIDLLALTEPEIAQAGIGRKFQKPERLRVPHGVREPRARPQR